MADIYYRDRNAGKADKDGKRAKPNWQYRFEGASISGIRKEIQRSGFQTKKEAVAAATEAYNEYVNGGGCKPLSEMSYADCLDNWMRDYVDVECNDNTQSNYEKKIRLHIKPGLGKYKLTSVSTDMIQRFINDMYKRKYSRNTLSVILGIISGSLKYAKKNKWVRYNESADVTIPSPRACKNQRKKERNAIPDNVMQKIHERFPEGHTCYIPILLGEDGGMRIGEAFAITWEDVDFEHSSININKQVQWYQNRHEWRFVPPKYDSCRAIYMASKVMDVLKKERKKQLQGRVGYGALFQKMYRDEEGYLNKEGRGVEIHMVTARIDGSYIQPRVMQHCSHVIHTELEYPEFDFHSLRHTHATRLSEAGVNIKEIQRRLGHKTMKVTERKYVHHTDAMEEESRFAIESICSKAL